MPTSKAAGLLAAPGVSTFRWVSSASIALLTFVCLYYQFPLYVIRLPLCIESVIEAEIFGFVQVWRLQLSISKKLVILIIFLLGGL